MSSNAAATTEANEGTKVEVAAAATAAATTESNTTTKADPVEAQTTPPETWNLKLPDGTKLTSEHTKALESFAKENKWTSEQAQKALDRDHALWTGFEKGQQELVKKEMDSWVPALQADTEFGGAKFNETVETAKRFVDRYGDAEFKQTLNHTGFGDHPGLIKLFARAARSMQDDKLVTSQTTTIPRPKSDGELFYGPNK